MIRVVSARVCLETGERFFAPETVQRLQKIIWEDKQPRRIKKSRSPSYEKIFTSKLMCSCRPPFGYKFTDHGLCGRSRWRWWR
ncbi:MAG: hypothetical protein EWV70_05345 [Microcystis flos-aquae Mf_QC_C_20070823_S20]|nr:MAG: hypothetical protein EWV70_05345 [Microcystis flos-aquae Mf_QC_C_20070823_S20]